MKARYSYPLLFLAPSAMVALAAAFMVVAFGAGVLWIFVYGDDPWPESANTSLVVLAAAASAITLGVLVALCYWYGKRREVSGGMTRAHMLSALGLTLGLPLLALLHQWQVGNLGNSSVPPNNSSKPTPLRGAA